MTERRHSEFMGRSLLANTIWFGRQMPACYGFQIDEAKFLSAISYLDDTGKRIALQPTGHSPKQTQLEFLRHLNKRALIIPFCHDRGEKYNEMIHVLIAADDGKLGQDMEFRQAALKRKDASDAEGGKSGITKQPARPFTRQRASSLQNQAVESRSDYEGQEETYDDIFQRLMDDDVHQGTGQEHTEEILVDDAQPTVAMNTTHVISRFLGLLNLDEVIKAIVDFEKRMPHKRISVDSTLSESQDIMAQLDEQPTARESVANIPNLWHHLHVLLQESH
ncbi:hypothetical protein BDN72DRAFT_906030, partial [Pluteus cervinus]